MVITQFLTLGGGGGIGGGGEVGAAVGTAAAGAILANTQFLSIIF